jgi:hypothetical protein
MGAPRTTELAPLIDRPNMVRLDEDQILSLVRKESMEAVAQGPIQPSARTFVLKPREADTMPLNQRCPSLWSGFLTSASQRALNFI